MTREHAADEKIEPASLPSVSLPTGLRLYLILPGALVLAFVISAPWTLGGRTISRLTPALAAALILVAAAMAHRPWREAFRRSLLERAYSFGGWTLLLVFAAASLFLLRVILSRYDALEVNAWDFSVYELAVNSSSNAVVLFSPLEGRSQLGTHASYLLFLFPPLYRLWSSHLWLLGAEAVLVAAAVLVAFGVCRRVLKDDLAALLVAGGLLLNTYVAKTVQYVFHVEVFYLPCLFLVAYGIVRKSPVVFLAAVLLTSLIKEDSVLPLLGVATAGLLFARRLWRWWSVAALMALVAFAISSFLVIPHFAGPSPGRAWYAPMWEAYGGTPLQVGFGILRHPSRVVSDLARSGARHLLETLGFFPFLGYEWFLAALPTLLVYGIAGGGRGGVAQFSIYYTASVLPILVVAAAKAVARFGRWHTRGISRRRRTRLSAILLFLLCAFDGASYVFFYPKPSLRDLKTLHFPVADRARVQGALLPHLPLDSSRFVPLSELSVDSHSSEAVLLDLDANPYPFSAQALTAFVERLEHAGFVIRRTRGGLTLAQPPRVASATQ